MYCGIVLLDKPLGLSSSAATQRVRHLLGKPRAGHVGSLDPLATGMLPICLGEATKIAGVMLDGHKCYRFTVALGARSSTGDAEGEIVATARVPLLTDAMIEAALSGFIGMQSQIPPMYSAIKRQGKPLYKLARAGVTVERAARTIEIVELHCQVWRQAAANAEGDYAGSELDCLVVCGKGTYVRTLAEDIAVALGTLGRVTALRREWVEPFVRTPMCSLDRLQAAVQAGEPLPLIAPADALPNMPRVRLAPAAAARLQQGQRVSAATLPAGTVLVQDDAGGMLGLALSDGAGELQPQRLFVQNA